MTLSLLIGAIFWQVRGGREQEYVWDRIGFITTMLGIGVVPLMMVELWNGKLCVIFLVTAFVNSFFSKILGYIQT